jgi:hypothetical protein
MPIYPPLRISTIGGVLAAIPHLLGFAPENSLVVLASRPPSAAISLVLRYDLADPPDREHAADVADHLVSVLAREHMTRVVLAGYGPGHLVTPVIDSIRSAAARDRLDVTDALRVHEARYWSYLCTDPACCPADGVAFDPATHPDGAAMAAAARAAGATPTVSSRAELAATLQPLAGPDARTMARATERAERTVARITSRDGARAIYRPGLAAVRHAIDAYRDGGQLHPDARHAWLSVVLSVLRIRDDAWARMDPAHAGAHLRLWTNTLRRAQPGYAAAPAALLAFTAWQLGEGALANVALDRALADTPGYPLAILLRDAIQAGIAPAHALPPLTPEEVADSYDDPGDQPGPAAG